MMTILYVKVQVQAEIMYQNKETVTYGLSQRNWTLRLLFLLSEHGEGTTW
jgi:hypothetical protein